MKRQPLNRKLTVVLALLCGAVVLPFTATSAVASGAVSPAASPTPPTPTSPPPAPPPPSKTASPAWIGKDPCVGNFGTVCFYSPSAGQTFLYQADNPPNDYPALGTPYTLYDSWVGYRVWLHQYLNWQTLGGWAYCINPYASGTIPAQYQLTGDVYISNNPNNC